MRRWVAGLLVLVAAALAGCGVPVAVERDPDARLPALRSWIWLPRPPPPQADAELARVDQRVRAATEREMRQRGFRKAERGRPDFLVTYYAAVAEPIDATRVAYAAGEPTGARRATDTSGRYAQGSLLFDVIDADTGRLLWRGVGRRVFHPEQTPDERRERIDDAVASILGELASR